MKKSIKMQNLRIKVFKNILTRAEFDDKLIKTTKGGRFK